MQTVDIVPGLCFMSIGVIWGYLAIINARLISLFRKNHPDEARCLLPAPGVRNPKLVSFFIKKRTALQFSDDKKFILLRKKFVQLLWLSLVWPFVIFFVLIVFAVFLAAN